MSWPTLLALSLLLLAGSSDGGRGRKRNRPRDRPSRQPQGIQLSPAFTGSDCSFGSEEDCLWDWEKDSFQARDKEQLTADKGSSWPGQHGFYRMSGERVKEYFRRAEGLNTTFFGPGFSRVNGDRGESECDHAFVYEPPQKRGQMYDIKGYKATQY